MNALWIDENPLPYQSLRGRIPEQIQLSHITPIQKSELPDYPWTSIDLLILNLLPESMERLDWIPVIRSKNPNISILLLCKEATKAQCLRAIELEANGLFEQPFDENRILELMLKHSQRVDELRLDQDRKSVFSQNRWIDLTQTEYKILETLKLARKRLTRAELQRAVWANSSISENNLDTHLTNLKRKIPELNHNLSVKRGLGYYLSLKGK
jgi:DNA-binding response OmpR family regulator